MDETDKSKTLWKLLEFTPPEPRRKKNFKRSKTKSEVSMKITTPKNLPSIMRAIGVVGDAHATMNLSSMNF